MTMSGSASPILPVYPGESLRISTEAAIVDRLVATLIDSVRSFSTAAGEVDDAELAALLRSRADRRRDLVERLLRSSVLDERDIDFDGTPVGALRRVWMELEGTVAEDGTLVRSVVHGERHALGECEDALEQNLASPAAEIVRHTVTDIRNAIEVLEAGLD